jgi:anti-sigma regulatory factor (Ser/Thr protein kinase)
MGPDDFPRARGQTYDFPIIDDVGGAVDDMPSPEAVPAGTALSWFDAPPDPAVRELTYTGVSGAAVPLTQLRHQLRDWAARLGLPQPDVDDLVLACYEAMVNAAEHAYRESPSTLDLRAVRTLDGHLVVTVRDHGSWRPEPLDPGSRGRGLLIIESLAHRSTIQPGPDGTAVHMQWRLPPAHGADVL